MNSVHERSPLAEPEPPGGACALARPRAGGPTARIAAALALAACLAALGFAAWLRPDPRGFGTHRQLGTGECGMLLVTGYPCPTCGMTTAFAHTVRLQWLAAAHAQVGGFILAVATIALVPVSAWVLVRGRWPRTSLVWITPYRLFFALLVLLLGSWALKIGLGLWEHTLPYR
ncbi:MAG: DUF2752 domain-containing protein [Planctomycetota bacterium]